MGMIVTAGRRAFKAVGDLLFIDEPVTEFETGPVRPILDVQASLEAAEVTLFSMVHVQTDPGGGADTIRTARPHAAADWLEIWSRGIQTDVAVPEDHDAFVIGAGATVNTVGNFTSARLFTRLQGTATVMQNMLWFGNTVTSTHVTRGGSFDAPLLVPFPWWVPTAPESSQELTLQIITTNAVIVVLMIDVIGAPKGVFRKLYG